MQNLSLSLANAKHNACLYINFERDGGIMMCIRSLKPPPKTNVPNALLIFLPALAHIAIEMSEVPVSQVKAFFRFNFTSGPLAAE